MPRGDGTYGSKKGRPKKRIPKAAANAKAKAKKAAKAKQRSNVSGVNRQVAQIKPGFPKESTLFGSTHDQTKKQVKKLTTRKVAPAKPKSTGFRALGWEVKITPGSPAHKVKKGWDSYADFIHPVSVTMRGNPQPAIHKAGMKVLGIKKAAKNARRALSNKRKQFVQRTGLQIK